MSIGLADGSGEPRDLSGWRAQRDALMRERDALIVERNGLMRERDEAIRRFQRQGASGLSVHVLPGRISVILDADGPHGGQLSELLRDASESPLTNAESYRGDVSPWVLAIGGGTDSAGQFRFSGESTEWLLPFGRMGRFHPVVLTEVLPLDLSGRWVACGFPGSGNAIVQGIAEHIARRYADQLRPTHPTSDVLGAYAADYRNRLETALQVLQSEVQAPVRRCAVDPRGDLVAVFGEREQSLLFGMPNHGFLHEVVHKTHQRCDSALARRLSLGQLGLLAVRHPLDILVSLANKMALVGLDLFGQPGLLRAVSRTLVDHGKSFEDACRVGRVLPVRYEDCQTDFGSIFARVARMMGIPSVESADIEVARDRLLNRPIAHEHHLWQPGAGKWRRYMDAAAWRVVEEAGVVAFARAQGYEATATMLAPQRDRVTVSQEMFSVATAYGILSYCTDDPLTHLEELGRASHLHVWHDGALSWFTNRFDAHERFMRWLETGELRKILAVGRLPREAAGASRGK